MDGNITISIDEYKELIEDSHTLLLLLNVIWGDAILNFDKTKLTFTGDCIEPIMRSNFPNSYAKRLKELQEAKHESD